MHISRIREALGQNLIGLVLGLGLQETVGKGEEEKRTETDADRGNHRRAEVERQGRSVRVNKTRVRIRVRISDTVRRARVGVNRGECVKTHSKVQVMVRAERSGFGLGLG